jgi:predicted  nucleic acid-binding Zn-ribbon protein
MIETMETKTQFEAMLEKARGLKPLRQWRDKLVLEMGNLEFNVISLQMKGKTMRGERTRIEAELNKLREKENDILQELRTFFAVLVKNAMQPVQENLPALMAKRLQLRNLLAEAANVHTGIKQTQKNWATELDALRKIAAELKSETNENGKERISFSLPEMPFPSPLVPALSVQQINHARNTGDNLAEILQALAKQIG